MAEKSNAGWTSGRSHLTSTKGADFWFSHRSVYEAVVEVPYLGVGPVCKFVEGGSRQYATCTQTDRQPNTEQVLCDLSTFLVPLLALGCTGEGSWWCDGLTF